MKQDQPDTRALIQAAFGSEANDILMNNTTGRYLSDMIEELIEGRVNQEREALRRIDEWAKAYPLDVFPEPDLKRAHEVLEAAGLSLGQISAHAMRHVLTGVQKIAAQAKP